ncbi:hypothetical protein FQZ97_844690 [compost metagenome]
MLRLSSAVSRSVSGSGPFGRAAVCVRSERAADFAVLLVLAAVLTGLPFAAVRTGFFEPDAMRSGFFATAALVLLSAPAFFAGEAAATRAGFAAGGTAMGCAPMAANGVEACCCCCCCCGAGGGVLSPSMMRAGVGSGAAAATGASGFGGSLATGAATGAGVAAATVVAAASARFDCRW